MPPLAVKTSIPFYATLLDTLHASGGTLRSLRQTHAVVLTVGLSRPDLLCSKLAACYARFSAVHDALLVFSHSNRRPTFVYNSLLRSLASLRRYTHAISLFRHSLSSSPAAAPDHRTFAAVLGSCSGPRFLPVGRALHGSCLAHGLCGLAFDSVIVCNSLISMYSKCGDVASARKMFEGMHVRSIVSWTAMIGAYGASGYPNDALKVFEEMLEVGVRPDGKAMMVVLGVCAYGGLAEMGWKVFGMMDGRFGVRPGVEHYTAMASLLGRVGLVEEVEELLGGMEALPDEVLWRVLVGACKMHGRMDVVQRVAERMYWKNEEREWQYQCTMSGLS